MDGLRLDAIPYLYEREGTNCENLPETHAFLRELRAHIDARYSDRMLLAEANQWPEDSAAYFGDGDECHMNFHFPVMPRMFMSVRMEDRFPLYDILEQTPAIPDNAQWALFLRNHDELTLEMVTDEERDYMYRVYAHDPQMRINLGIRRRLAPLLGNNRRRIELLNGLLMSLPGTPVIYYGDEIGMGDNVYLGDRNGVRTPMQWSGDRNAGFSQANRQRLFLPVITDPEYHFEALNVETQQNNAASLLWWMKRLIALRRQTRAFGRGSLTFLHPENRRIAAFVREYEDERILVVANMSRFVQHADLDLSAYQGLTPVEMFGRVEFPRIHDRPMFMTLGPHAFIWFSLEADPSGRGAEVRGADDRAPTLNVTANIDALLGGRSQAALVAVLPGFLRARRWFRSKARRIKSVRMRESVRVPFDGDDQVQARLAIFDVEYTEGEAEAYLLPLALARGEHVERIVAQSPQALVAHVAPEGEDGAQWILYDALFEPAFTTRPARRCRRPPPLRGQARRSDRHADTRLPQAARACKHPARAHRGPRRAEQHVGHVRRPAHPEDLPQAGVGRESGPGDRHGPDRRGLRARAVGRRLACLPGRPRGSGGDRHSAAVRAQRGRRVGADARLRRCLLRACRRAGRRAAGIEAGDAVRGARHGRC